MDEVSVPSPEQFDDVQQAAGWRFPGPETFRLVWPAGAGLVLVERSWRLAAFRLMLAVLCTQVQPSASCWSSGQTPATRASRWETTIVADL